MERVRGLAVGSTRTLDTKTAKHSLTQRRPSPRVSGLAIGLSWPAPLGHPKPPLPATVTTALQKKSELTCKDTEHCKEETGLLVLVYTGLVANQS